jgi:TetR/AcrR family transcriptional regulator, cholesterol catabolism regulator
MAPQHHPQGRPHGGRGGGRVAATAAQPRRGREATFADRRAEIVDLAAKLFAERGYASTGIRDISDAANLARGALYYYIGSKESLLGEINDRAFDPLLEAIRAIAALDIPAAERLRMISTRILAQIMEHRDYVWVFFHEHRSLTGERRVTVERKQAEFEALLEGVFRQGVQAGEFKVDDIRVVTQAFVGMHNYTYQWMRAGIDVDSASLSTLYCDIILSGLSGQPANDRTAVSEL